MLTDAVELRHDWDVVVAAQSGDRDAFSQIYAAHSGWILRFLHRRLSNRALAEDLTSETFLRALRRIDTVNDQGRDIRGWLTTIARNLAADYFKSSRARRDQLVDFTEWEFREPVQHNDPATLVEQAWVVEVVRRAVDQLPLRAHQIVTARYLDEASVTDTAAWVGISDMALRAAARRGLLRLADDINDPAAWADDRSAALHRRQHQARVVGRAMTATLSGRCQWPAGCTVLVKSRYCTEHYHKLYRAGRLRAGFIDPAPARAYIHKHLSRGGSLRALAATSGVCHSSLSDLAHGRTARVRIGIADAILAVSLRPSNNQCSRWITELALAGHSVPDIATACGIPATTLYKATQSGRFVDHVARALSVAHRVLSRRPGRSAMAARLANAKARAAA